MIQFSTSELFSLQQRDSLPEIKTWGKCWNKEIIPNIFPPLCLLWPLGCWGRLLLSTPYAHQGPHGWKGKALGSVRRQHNLKAHLHSPLLRWCPPPPDSKPFFLPHQSQNTRSLPCLQLLLGALRTEHSSQPALQDRDTTYHCKASPSLEGPYSPPRRSETPKAITL